ncbi:hypothetical protein ACM01_37290, partial [Streptomyces viridochromogenes]
MRYRFVLPRHLAGALVACVTLAGLLSTPARRALRVAGRDSPRLVGMPGGVRGGLRGVSLAGGGGDAPS